MTASVFHSRENTIIQHALHINIFSRWIYLILLNDGPFIEPDHLSFLEERHPAVTKQDPADRILITENTQFLFSKEGLDLDKFINRLIIEAMNISENNKTLAAKLLNISPRTISRRLEKLDL